MTTTIATKAKTTIRKRRTTAAKAVTSRAAKKAKSRSVDTEKEVRNGAAGRSMDVYLDEIGRYELLSKDEEITLAKRIQKGDEEAREAMITANLRLVVRIAQDFTGMGVTLEDLVQAGNIGLMTAAERFDPSFGARFSTYAACWIKQKIRRTLEIGRMVRLPTHVHEKLRAMRKFQDQVLQDTGRDASTAEVSEETGIPAEKVRKYMQAAQHVASLDAPLDGFSDESDGPKLGDTVSGMTDADPSIDLEEREIRTQLGEALPVLDSRERRIIKCRFGLGGEPELTLEEVGRAFGISRERVRQIQNVALEKLRAAMLQNESHDEVETVGAGFELHASAA